MFKSKWALFLVLLVVVFVGLAMVAFAVNPEGISLALGLDLMGHVCGSVCAI
ncbi:MAG: hypothetical protein H6667_03150 [Ardenticatenaceae bacterium]|nr:hypothetical protein [Ardenticatenaceae bacterium]MCB9443007.1 hypothetical protein [Ardenticatenaceae bacterium]